MTRDAEVSESPAVLPKGREPAPENTAPTALVPAIPSSAGEAESSQPADNEWVTLVEPPSWGSREPLVVAGEVVPPEIVHRVTPDFSSVGQIRVWGVPVVEIVIGIDGRVERIRFLKSVDSEFDRAIIAAISQWRYEPAKLNGEPVAVYLNLTVHVHPR